MNSKQFLLWGGVVLVVVGVLGYIGIIGPTPERSLFGANWWFDNNENIAHTVLGVVGVAASFYLASQWQKWLTFLLGVVGIVVGLYSAVVGPTLLGANLENPADTVLHLVVGGWALYASVWTDKVLEGK